MLDDNLHVQNKTRRENIQNREMDGMFKKILGKRNGLWTTIDALSAYEKNVEE